MQDKTHIARAGSTWVGELKKKRHAHWIEMCQKLANKRKKGCNDPGYYDKIMEKLTNPQPSDSDDDMDVDQREGHDASHKKPPIKEVELKFLDVETPDWLEDMPTFEHAKKNGIQWVVYCGQVTEYLVKHLKGIKDKGAREETWLKLYHRLAPVLKMSWIHAGVYARCIIMEES